MARHPVSPQVLMTKKDINDLGPMEVGTMKKLALIICLMLSLTILVGCIDEGGDDDDGDDVIYFGKGLEAIEIGDTEYDVIERYGEPDEDVESGGTRWLSYREDHDIDFLTNRSSHRIIEIRFNVGYEGETENGIDFDTELDDVLEEHGGALLEVNATPGEVQSITHGANRVLYIQKEGGNITAYKFMDARKGVLYWFNEEGEINQIVVFDPY